MKIYDVFISYRRREADGREQGSLIAKTIHDFLTSKGLRVFLDVEEMENGLFPEQLQWQVAHAPNYIFIATEAAMHFRDVLPPDIDYVAEELKLALKLYPDNPGDRTILPVIPYDVRVPADSDASYPKEVHRLFKHNAPRQLTGEVPSEKNLKEILEKVTCVNRGNLWNAGYRWYETSKTEGHRFASLSIDRTIMPQAGFSVGDDVRLPIRAGLEEQPDKPLMDQIRDTEGHLYLIGEGGIGKTTALFSIMEEVYGTGKSEDDIERNRLNGQIPLFIELSRAPDTYGRLYEGGVSTFIKRAVYMQMRTDLKAKQISVAAVEQVQEVFNLDRVTAVKPIEDLFKQTTGAPEYLLLLDGLNEVSRTEIGYTYKDGDGTEKTGRSAVVSMILGEISDLMENSPNVRVILTSRSREESNWSDKATLLYLSGVKSEAVESYLRGKKVPEARINAALHNAALKEILRVPLFLTMYASLTGEDELLSRGEILKLFFHQKKEKLYTAKDRIIGVGGDIAGAASAKRPDRLTEDMQCYILDYILPTIAWRMVKADEFHIQRDFLGKDGEGLDEIIEFVLTDDEKTSVNGMFGRTVFVEYASGSNAGMSTAKIAERLIERLGGRMTEVCDGILDCAVMTLGILQSDGVSYAFIHQHVRDYFAAVYQINRLKMAVYLQEHNRNGLALTCLEDWKKDPLPFVVRQFIGEALGECHNKPRCDDEGSWHYNVPVARSMNPATLCERNLLTRALNIYRGRFDNEDGYGLWNLIQILKEVRADLSGEDFSELDLTGIRLNGYCLGKKGICSMFNYSKVNERTFFPSGNVGPSMMANYSNNGNYIIVESMSSTDIDEFQLELRAYDSHTLEEVGVAVPVEPEKNTSSFVSLSGIKCEVYDVNHHSIELTRDDNRVQADDNDLQFDLAKKVVYSSPHCDFYIREVSPISIAQNGGNRLDILRKSSDDLIATLFGHSNEILSVRYYAEYNGLIIEYRGYVAELWNTKTWRKVDIRKRIKARAHSIRYSPDGKTILITSDDPSVYLLDSDTLSLVGKLNSNMRDIKSVSYSPTDNFFAIACADKIGKMFGWNVHGYRLIGVMKADMMWHRCVAFSPDGNKVAIASNDGLVKIWDSRTFKEIGSLTGHQGRVYSVAYSPCGKFIITASGDKTAKIWDSESYCEIEPSLKGHEDGVLSACFSNSGDYILTASYDQSIKIWNTKTHSLLDSIEVNDRVFSVAFSKDDRYLTSSCDDTAIVWDFNKLKQDGLVLKHEYFVNSCVFSPDDNCIVTVSKDQTAKVWDTATHELKKTLTEHKGSVNQAVYNHDGSHLLTASSDGSVKVWETQKYKCLYTIHNIPGLEVLGCDFRNLHPNSKLSDEDKRLLWEYGARFNDKDTPPC